MLLRMCMFVCVCVEVSTRMVSEYKTKLQISEAENSRLDGMVRTHPLCEMKEMITTKIKKRNSQISSSSSSNIT